MTTQQSGEKIFQNRQFANWKDILSASITNAEEITKHLPVDQSHIRKVVSCYPMRINPYFLSLIKSGDGAIFKQVVPDIQEILNNNLENDPLGEELQSPVPNLIHRYPGRVLFMVSNQCAVYCRFCMRKRKVGNPFIVTQKTIDDGITYIKENRSICEVIISGGDPLLLEDEELSSIMDKLRSIRHIEIIRIHTRVPSALPQRVTPALAEMICQYHPVFMNIHFNHPDEITVESSSACAILSDAGIPLGSQTVLLKGINTDPAIMKQLMQRLVKIRVKPYALHHPDP
ncbi:MAG: KamA family radical SAM protein, partial [Desulfobacterales bacterium]|nr:KamA family radical SAM protein [Desulfobacterales bacterium]